ncbi:MAG: hypothetical protein AB7Y46_14110 [Armatimonadota bacterium]
MPEIRIVIDPSGEGRPGASDLVVVSDADYFAARRRIRSALTEDAHLTVWVRSERLTTRFDDLSREPRVMLTRYDPRAELAAALGVSGVPDVITPEAIREFDLVARARELGGARGQTALDWCLSALLGDGWAVPPHDAAAVQAILFDLAGGHSPTLDELVRWRLRTWAEASPASDLWFWLADDPQDRARCLLACMAVIGYGDAALQWLTQAGFVEDTVRDGMALVRAESGVWGPVPTEALPPTIRHHLPSKLARGLKRDGASAVRAASARTEEEMRAVLDYLRTRAREGELLSCDERDDLASWAESCPVGPLSRRLMLAVELTTEAPLPAPLPDDADWTHARQWIEQQYMPAYVARAVSDRLVETSDAVASFEEWLCDHYPSLMLETQAGLQWACAGAAGRASEALVVVVLLDGVPLPVTRWLRDAVAEEEGVSVTHEGVHLAPLPTLTPFGKPVLLSARLPDQAETDEVKALASTFAIDPLSCEVVASVGDLVGLRPGRLVFSHFRTVDSDLLHRPKASLDRWLDCYEVVATLGEHLKTLVRKAQAESVPLWLCCASDHGWTELPSCACGAELPPGVDDKAISHHRVVAGTAQATYGIALPSSQFFLPEDYTIARGYSYLGRRPQGAVHGGATPQEIAVYGFWLTTAPTGRPDDLVLEIAGEVRRAMKHNEVELLVSNPNREDVAVSEVCLERVAISHGRLPLTVPALGSGGLSVVCDASGCREAFPVSGTLAWQTSSGTRRIQRVEFSVPTRGAATTDPKFEDMFEV